MSVELNLKLLPKLEKDCRLIIQTEKHIHVYDLDRISIDLKFPAIKEFMSSEECKMPINSLHEDFIITLIGEAGKNPVDKKALEI